VNLEELRNAILMGRVRISDHADEQAAADKLTVEEIFASVLAGEIIEDYPSDRPYPSCLVFGPSSRNEPVHSVWAYTSKTGWAVLVTVYLPDPERWVDPRTRKSR
jgi:uncharacterized protein DUF4258